jgi:hypothetical protein
LLYFSARALPSSSLQETAHLERQQEVIDPFEIKVTSNSYQKGGSSFTNAVSATLAMFNGGDQIGSYS